MINTYGERFVSGLKNYNPKHLGNGKKKKKKGSTHKFGKKRACL